MLGLGVEHTVIKRAVYNFPHSLYDQKSHVFNHWLKNDRNASWSRVIDALKQKEVGEGNLAAQLEKKYAWNDPRASLN